MREIKYPYIIKDGKGTVSNTKSFKKELEGLKDGRYELVIRKLIKKRSNPLNRYYWGCLINEVIIGLVNMGFEESELNPDVVHEMLKNKFLKKQMANDDGEFIEIIVSTTELGNGEFMDYCANIQRWSAEFLNHYIADPNEQAEINF